MERTEQYYREKIAEEIKHILNLDQNKEAAQLFWKTLESVKPKTCMAKSGWRAGEGIDFSLALEKGGTKNSFDEFIANIPDLAETHGFICGLYPKKVHLNPVAIINNTTHIFLTFKLLKNE